MSAGGGGVYVHFPYCAHRCVYCDFTLQTPKRIPQRRYTDGVLAELARRLDGGWQGWQGPARSLYFGGGTPSLWALDQLGRVVAAVRQRVGIAAGAEVTVEANPDQVDDAWLDGAQALGVNRVSLGVQSLSKGALAALSRRHGVPQALAAIERLRGAGLASWSLDFIFGVPQQSLGEWRRELEAIAALGAPHLSVYGLTVEPRTLLAKAIRDGRSAVVDAERQADMLVAARRALTAAGYQHYEVSSHARPGHRAVHNAAYWDGSPYLALGAGAHGWDGRRRWRNLGRVKRYLEALDAGALPHAEVEIPDAETAAFERVMTGLRRLDQGVELGASWARWASVVRERERAGLLEVVEGTRVRLTEAGLLVMDDTLLALLEA